MKVRETNCFVFVVYFAVSGNTFLKGLGCSKTHEIWHTFWKWQKLRSDMNLGLGHGKGAQYHPLQRTTTCIFHLYG